MKTAASKTNQWSTPPTSAQSQYAFSAFSWDWLIIHARQITNIESNTKRTQYKKNMNWSLKPTDVRFETWDRSPRNNTIRQSIPYGIDWDTICKKDFVTHRNNWVNEIHAALKIQEESAHTHTHTHIIYIYSFFVRTKSLKTVPETRTSDRKRTITICCYSSPTTNQIKWWRWTKSTTALKIRRMTEFERN